MIFVVPLLFFFCSLISSLFVCFVATLICLVLIYCNRCLTHTHTHTHIYPLMLQCLVFKRFNAHSFVFSCFCCFFSKLLFFLLLANFVYWLAIVSPRFAISHSRLPPKLTIPQIFLLIKLYVFLKLDEDKDKDKKCKPIWKCSFNVLFIQPNNFDW